MSNQVMPFEFDGMSVRVVEDVHGESLFVVKDILEALEFSKNTRAGKSVAHIPDEWKRVHPIPTLGGTQSLQVLTEQGLYQFVCRCDKPKAIPFQRWVAGEVLPSIRKHGGYIQGQYEMTEEQLMAKALLHANSVMGEKDAQIDNLTNVVSQQTTQIQQDTPKREFYDSLVDSSDLLSMGQVAKMFGVGRSEMFEVLRDDKILQSNQDWNVPYGTYMKRGYFDVKYTTVRNTNKKKPTTRVTQKGLKWLFKQYS